MSVLNKTLKGLEQRQADTASALLREKPVTVAPISDAMETLHKMAIPLLTLVAIALVAYVVYQKDVMQQLFTASTSNVSSVPQSPLAETSMSAQPSVKETVEDEPKQEGLLIKPETTQQASHRDVVENNSTTVVPEPRLVAQKATSVEPSKAPVKKTEPSSESELAPRQTNMKQIAQVTAAQQANEHFQAGKKAFTFGLVGEAIGALEQCIAVLEEHIECRSLLAAAFYGRQESEKASNVLEQGLSLKPNSMEWRTLLARIYADNKQYSEVLSVLAPQFESQGGNDFWILKGLAAQQLKQHEVALRSFKKLTLSEPEQGKWWLAMARSAEALQQWQNAMQYYTTATQIGNLSPASQRFAVERLQFIRGRLNAP